MHFTSPSIRMFLPVALAAFSAAAGASPATGPAPATVANLSSVRVPFVANSGEVDRQVAYYARTFAGTVFVTGEGRITYSLPARGTGSSTSGWALAESFPSAPAPRTAAGGERSATHVSRFTYSAPRKGDVAVYDDIRLGEVAPGIDARVRAAGANVEKIFTVAAGADASRLKVRIDGTSKLSIRDDGGLVVATGLGEIVFSAPVAWQDNAGERSPVSVQYALAGGSDYGFVLGAHDRDRPVVIDPLIRSTFSGGDGDDVVRAIAVHPGTGNIYATGYTKSTNFPGTTGAIPGAQGTASAAGGQEAFVAQYSVGLTQLIRASYYGGDGVDEAKAIAIHPNTGDVYIAGTTTSNTGTLLGSAGNFAGQADGFIARFDGALSSVLSARYYGGSAIDTVWGVAIDPVSGDVVIAGDTTSANIPLGTAGSAQGASGGAQDAFVARFSSNLAALLRGTYFGGSGADRALSVALDVPTGDVIIGGSTTSTTLPNSATAAFPSFGGNTDGFVARLDSGLTTIRMSSYFGGSDTDQVNGVAVHPYTGDIYVAGETRSLSIPAPVGGQAAIGGGLDAFIARFSGDLTGVRVFTYFGKLGDDSAKSIAISRYTGEIYIAGSSDSATIPASPIDGPQTANAGGVDAFIARFDAALTAVQQSTFLGGTGSDTAWSVALNETSAFIGGETSSTTLPGAGAGSAQAAKLAGTDGFVASLTSDLVAGNSNPQSFTFVPVTNALPATLQISAPTKITLAGNTLAYVDGQPGSTWCASSAQNCVCDKTGNVYVTGVALITVQTPQTPAYFCVRHVSATSPDTVTESRLHVGAVSGAFRVATAGGAGLTGCTLDVDGNGAQDALTDGLLILRALFGLTGTAVTNNAIGNNATRTAWTDIRAYLNANCGSTIP